MPAARFDIPNEILEMPLEWIYEDNSANSRHSTEQLIEMQLELPRNRYWGDWVRLILREAEGLASEETQTGNRVVTISKQVLVTLRLGSLRYRFHQPFTGVQLFLVGFGFLHAGLVLLHGFRLFFSLFCLGLGFLFLWR
jgi:hypothetical protein